VNWWAPHQGLSFVQLNCYKFFIQLISRSGLYQSISRLGLHQVKSRSGLYQGTTLVVPIAGSRRQGFSPCKEHGHRGLKPGRFTTCGTSKEPALSAAEGCPDTRRLMRSGRVLANVLILISVSRTTRTVKAQFAIIQARSWPSHRYRLHVAFHAGSLNLMIFLDRARLLCRRPI
jgi:hypothetical protein